MDFWRTEYWRDYLLNNKIGAVFIDHSFYFGNKFVPLIQERGTCELFSPGFNDNKQILMKIRDIAEQHDIKRIEVNSQIKSYLNISGYTCIINPADINPSKGHKSAIKTSCKYLKYQSLTETKQFMLDYFKIAGKVTRPEKTFEILRNWIDLGFGTLLKATYEEKTAGYTYILHYGDYGYYFMSGTFPQYRKYNVGHYLQSVAFDILKDKGVVRYEIGDQAYNSLVLQPTEKEKNISLFKREFGGNIEIKPKSEYFFDEAYFKQIMQERINNYARSEIKQCEQLQ